MQLASSTWTDASEVDTDLALLPLGSTEQHGPHAPLSTDTVLAEAVAATGAEAYDGEVVVAPALPVGVSEEHRGFAGTLWLSPDAFRATVRDVVESLVDNGWPRVVLVNGHGGNTAALEEVAARVTRDRDAYVVPFTWFDAIDREGVPMGHAGAVETAVLRAVDSDLVRDDRVEEAADGAADRWGEWVGGVNVAYDVDDFASNGVVGDPSAGDADLGERLLSSAGGALADVLAALAERPID